MAGGQTAVMHADLSALFDLSGRTAIVTGGSRGLGRAMALGFAKAGANVVIASRKLDSCQSVVAAIEALGGPGLAVATRMQEPDDVAALVAATVERFGGISIVVNNAATVLDRPLDGVEPATFAGAFGTNLLAPMLLVQAARPHLAASGHGAVLNIISIAADRATPDRYYYPPVKAALAQVTRSMARDLAGEACELDASQHFLEVLVGVRGFGDRVVAGVGEDVLVGEALVDCLLVERLARGGS